METAGGFEVGLPFQYIVKYRNVGKEPAIDVAMSEGNGPTLIEPPGPEKNWSDAFANVRNETCDGKIPGKGALVIYPYPEERSYWVGTGFVIPKEVADRSKILVVQGCMAYTSFNRVRYSGYCFFLNPDPPPTKINQWPFWLCQTGNFAN
jgi:hypothetical protein